MKKISRCIIVILYLLIACIISIDVHSNYGNSTFNIEAVPQENNRNVKIVNGILHVPYCHYILVKNSNSKSKERIYFQINDDERMEYGRPITLSKPGYNEIVFNKGFYPKESDIYKLKVFVDNVSPKVTLKTTCMKVLEYAEKEIVEQCDPMLSRPPATLSPVERIAPPIEEVTPQVEWGESASFNFEKNSKSYKKVPGGDESFTKRKTDDLKANNGNIVIPAQRNYIVKTESLRIPGRIYTGYSMDITDESSYQSAQYRIDGEEWVNYSKNFFFPSYGYHMLEIRVIDGVGYETYIQQPIIIDGVTVWYNENAMNTTPESNMAEWFKKSNSTSDKDKSKKESASKTGAEKNKESEETSSEETKPSDSSENKETSSDSENDSSKQEADSANSDSSNESSDSVSTTETSDE